MFQQLKNVYHFLTAWVFQLIYNQPAKKLKIIGITGTDGKTTTSSLIYHVLQTASKKVSLITSVGAFIGGVQRDTGFHVTTPDPQDIPKYLVQAVNHGDEYFVLEITSHALDQHRAAGIRFEVAGITNITHEHLGYHGTLDNYIRAKSKIAKLSNITFVNCDQKEIVNKIIQNAPKSIIKCFGLREKADYSQDISKLSGIYLENYNKYNFLLAYAVCNQLGIDEQTFIKASRTFAFPPGRMEELYNDKFIVISDFAHTPNALGAALSAVLQKYPHKGRLIHVFGAAALRDDSKRSAMGKMSGTYTDIVILTEEDYRTEDPQRIFSMLSQGLRDCGFTKADSKLLTLPNKSYTEILDRSQAIQKAISIARSGDIVIITGKGQEQSLCRGTKEYPYDERQIVADSLKHQSTAVQK